MNLKADFARDLLALAYENAIAEDARKRGMIAVKVAPDLFIVYEDVKKPWEVGGPSVVPKPRPPHRGEQQAVIPPREHPIDKELEEQKRIRDFWNSLR